MLGDWLAAIVLAISELMDSRDTTSSESTAPKTPIILSLVDDDDDHDAQVAHLIDTTPSPTTSTSTTTTSTSTTTTSHSNNKTLQRLDCAPLAHDLDQVSSTSIIDLDHDADHQSHDARDDRGVDDGLLATLIDAFPNLPLDLIKSEALRYGIDHGRSLVVGLTITST